MMTYVFCPECGLPPVPAEGKTYIATDGWLWKDDRTIEGTYEFTVTTTYICVQCRVTIVFPGIQIEEMVDDRNSRK